MAAEESVRGIVQSMGGLLLGMKDTLRAFEDGLKLIDAELWGQKVIEASANQEAPEPEPRYFEHVSIAHHVTVRDRSVMIDGINLGILRTDQISALFEAEREGRLWIRVVEREPESDEAES